MHFVRKIYLICHINKSILYISSFTFPFFVSSLKRKKEKNTYLTQFLKFVQEALYFHHIALFHQFLFFYLVSPKLVVLGLPLIYFLVLSLIY